MNEKFVCSKDEIISKNKEIIQELVYDFSAEEQEALKNKQFEEEKYKEFKEIASKEDFFSLKHIEKLGLDWNILIVLGEKNIGKTQEKYRIIREQIKEGKKIIYGRATKGDLLQETHILRGDETAPIILSQSKEGFLVNEKVYLGNGTWKKGAEVGRGFYLKEANKIGGASEWTNYSYVLLDEIIPYDSKCILRPEHLSSWAAFLSSIVRNTNHDLKVCAFGNLLDKNSAFLDFYQIKRDDKLRYITRGGEETKILYLNIGELYKKGFGFQKGVAQHAPPDFALALRRNYILSRQINIISPNLFEKMDRFKAFVLKARKNFVIDDYYICEIRKAYKQNFKTFKYDTSFYALKISPLRPYLYFEGVNIMTDDFYVKNNFKNTQFILSLLWYYEFLRKNQIKNNLFYYDEETILHITNLLRKEYKDGLI